MIDLLIYYIHFYAAIYAFTKSWQNSGLKDGLLSVALFALVFTIGWALTGTIAHNLYPENWETIWISRDTISLLLLLPPEYYFYKKFILEF